MTDRAAKIVYWAATALAIIWYVFGALDIFLDFNRNRDIAPIEVVIVAAVGLAIWIVGYSARFVK
jgi:hypothetical protein